MLKLISEGKIGKKIEVTGRRGRSGKQLLDDLRETRRYWKLKHEVPDDTAHETWKRLWTSRTTDYVMMMMMMMMIVWTVRGQ